MAKSKGTKKVVWSYWTVQIFGRDLSGRGQFNAERMRDYERSPKDSEEFKNALGHIASVIKGQIANSGKLTACELRALEENKRLITKDNLELGNPKSGPKEIPRGRAPKEPEAQATPSSQALTRRRGSKAPKVSPDQQQLF